MCEELRILFWLLTKNFIVRGRHWAGGISEFLLPGCIIGMILVIRSNLVEPGTDYRYHVPPAVQHVYKTTYFPMETSDEVMRKLPTDSSICYTPKNEFTKRLMEAVESCAGQQHEVHGFDREDELLGNLTDNSWAIFFHDTAGQDVPKTLDYTIRSSAEWDPSELYGNDVDDPNGVSDKIIHDIPIVPLQMCLDDAYIDIAVPNPGTKSKVQVVIQKMPYRRPHNTINPYELVTQAIIVYGIGGLIFSATIFLIPSYVSAEKTTGVNTLLKINGVKSYQNFLSWLVTGMLFSIIPVLGVTILLKSVLKYDQKAFFQYSDGSVIWLALFLNATHVYAFCLHAASYFSKAWLAKLVAMMITILMDFIFVGLRFTTSYYVVPYLGLFFPTAVALRIFDELSEYENGQTGAHWWNIINAANPALGVEGSLGFIMAFSLLGTVLHFVLAVYMDTVLPSKYGVRKSPWFFLENLRRNKVSKNNDEPTQMDGSMGRPQILEPVAEGTLVPGIELRDLAKRFTGGCCRSRAVEAVRGVSVEFYKGQITALLGHNGAGKTTTFSMLTGLTAPTRGTAYINGKDLKKDLDEIRSDLGVCLQENTMFPDLTVRWQVRLVGLLRQKNRTMEQVTQDVDNLLKALDMSDKRDVMPHKLSGGQKRRLCLAMALIGRASTLFLDEPTSGMDPEASRRTWDIILRIREQKTIIITTHRMEEADVLGDRIAIMAAGQVKCYGTPMFLKKHYGHNSHVVTLSTTPRCNEVKIRELFGSEAKIDATHRRRIVVTIPLTSSLPRLLDNIESQKAALGITGVGVSTMSLEEVFLEAVNEEGLDDVDGFEDSPARSYEYLTGCQLTWQRIEALLRKKLIYCSHNKTLLLLIIVGGLLAATLSALPGLIYHIIGGRNVERITVLVGLGLYRSPEALIYSTDPEIGKDYKKFVESQGATGTLIQRKNGLLIELLLRAIRDRVYYKNRIITSAEFNSGLIAKGFYSGRATFSAAITVNAIYNLILKRAAGEEYSIVAKIGNPPVPRKDDGAEGPPELDAYSSYILMIFDVLLFSIVFFLVIGLFVRHPLLENSTKIKHLQQMTGVSPFLYWGTMFAVDYMFYIVVTVLTVSWIYLLDFLAGLNKIQMGEVEFLLMLFLLFGINVLLLVYIHSFIRKRFFVVHSIFTAWPLLLAIFIIITHEVLFVTKKYENANVIQRIFSLQPLISFMFGYLKFREIAWINAMCRRSSNYTTKPFRDMVQCSDLECYDGYCAKPFPYIGHGRINITINGENLEIKGECGEFLLYLLLVPIALLGILCMLEYQAFAKSLLECKGREKKSIDPNQGQNDFSSDSEVAKENSIVRQAIFGRASKQNPEDENVFLAYGLSKRYGDLKAVKEVNFRVTESECFGLLGVNGAGKSTTFRMLVGEETPSTGILYRGSHSLKSNRTKYLEGIGYCQQNDASIPCFNAMEHLLLFAALRGVPKSEIRAEVDMWIDKLQLKEYARNPSGTYSGGYKRRLNIAMALIGSPKMIMLDEPTTGVDPEARRSVWTVLQSCQAAGQAIILTSHSMEECETLCDRLVVMVKGRLVCVGASQELKQRFGAGFNISVKLDPGRSEPDFQAIKDSIENAFICKLEDEHPGHLFYHITDPKATWVKMFGTMNDVKSNYACVEDFTVSTSTLEQLFMQFARSDANSYVGSQVPSQNTADPMDL